MVTLTGSLLDAGQGVLDPKRTRVRIESNASTLGAFDAAGHLHLGGEDAAVSADGSFEFTDLVPSADIDGLAYQVLVNYPTVLGKGRADWSSGWFPLTADATLAAVASIATPQAVPITSLEASIDTAASNVRADTLTAATNAQNSATAAATSETNAAGSATAAATSETNAATSASHAADSAAAAAASAAPATSLIRSTVSGDISTDGTDIATQLDARIAGQIDALGDQTVSPARVAATLTDPTVTGPLDTRYGDNHYVIDPAHTWQQFAADLTAHIAATDTDVTFIHGTIPAFDNDTTHVIAGPDLPSSERVLDFGDAHFPSTQTTHLVLANITAQHIRYVCVNPSGTDRAWFIYCTSGRVVVEDSLIYVESQAGARQVALFDSAGLGTTIELKDCFLINHAQAGAFNPGDYMYLAKGARRVEDCFLRITSASTNTTLTALWFMNPAADSWGMSWPNACLNNKFSWFVPSADKFQAAIYYDGDTGKLLTTGNVRDLAATPVMPVNPYPTQPS